MNARSSSNVGKIVAGSIGVAFLLLVFIALGQFVGGLVFGLIEKLPSESPSVVLMRLWHYWPIYAHITKVRNALAVASYVAGAIGIGPLLILSVVVLSSKFKRRELHGSARFASLREIRKAGLVADDHA
jgi:type IV secretory pathway TraG/TraD family ATPase VirD4